MCSGNAARKTAANQAIALAVIAVFFFQFGRVYLVTKLDAFYACPHTQVWTSVASHEFETQETASAEANPASEEALESFLPPSGDDSDSIRSCKESLDGLGLTPIQPIVLPVAVSPQRLPANIMTLARRADFPLENDLTALFRPPRNLS